MSTQRTLVIIKPDGVQRGLIGAIIQRFEQKGFRLVSLKLIWSNEEKFRQHYSEHSTEQYFPGLVQFMSSSPVVPMVWEGVNAIAAVRRMIGSDAPGTIRGDFCPQAMNGTHGTVIHAADSIKAAKREIDLWFREEELIDLNRAKSKNVCLQACLNV